MTRLRLPTLLWIPLLAAAIPAAAATVSTFDSGNEGWVITNPVPTSHIGTQTLSSVPAPWDGTAGQPAGSLQAADGHGFTWDYLSAPASFLGDRSADYGLELRFDIRLGTNGSINPGPAVALEGTMHTLFFNMAPTPRDAWVMRTVSLTETGWLVDDYEGSTEATQADMNAVLGDLQGIYLLIGRGLWRL